MWCRGANKAAHGPFFRSSPKPIQLFVSEKQYTIIFLIDTSSTKYRTCGFAQWQAGARDETGQHAHQNQKRWRVIPSNLVTKPPTANLRPPSMS
jgi:hypothetical protein